ncbi:Rne/Rng family ribonuclease [Shouchella sp. 1P09AA]|uniref:Rne/Rng family ribonuclease n=1 Tax=unclassified Shouchella TaxID=2893065 RepID=UPI00399F43F7
MDMTKTILMKQTALKREAVLVDQEKAVEWSIESEFIPHLIGSVYKAKVEKVMPNMQAAFIDIGSDKNGFLHRDELYAFQKDQREGKDVLSIAQYLKAGTELIVQVTKESDGTKGPRLTEIISLPGHGIVYLPAGQEVSISKKIDDESKRQELKEKMSPLLQEDEGMIIRTQGNGASIEEISEELRFLRALWQKTQTHQDQIPYRLYQGSSLIEQLVKRQSKEELHEWVVDHYDDFKLVQQLLPASLKDRVRLVPGNEDVFSTVQKQLDKALRRHVWLKNGGYLIFDETEALTVVDINSGKYKKKKDKFAMAIEVNEEAAIEICRQLRLRNYSGMVLIDFIEMENERAQKKIVTLVEKELEQDLVKTSVKGFTKLGMLELTRKKTARPIAEVLQEPCPTCHGSGRVLTDFGHAFQLENELVGYRGEACIIIGAHSSIRELFYENDEAVLKRLEAWMDARIYFVENNSLSSRKPYEVIFQGDYDSAKQRLKSLAISD